MTADLHALLQQQLEDSHTILELREQKAYLEGQVAGLEHELDFWKKKYRRAAETLRRMEGGEL